MKTMAIKQTYFYMFKRGDPYEYPGHAIWYKAPGEIKLATGKASDCYFFDTRGLHAALPCLIDKRVVCFVTLTVQSFRNKILDSIKAM